jgi:hypothetical protein
VKLGLNDVLKPESGRSIAALAVKPHDPQFRLRALENFDDQVHARLLRLRRDWMRIEQ